MAPGHPDLEAQWPHRRPARATPGAAVGVVPGAFYEAVAGEAEADVDRLMAEWVESRRAVAGASHDDRFVHDNFGAMSLRWVFNHIIAASARHIGHADLLRERIDGVIGE